MNFNELKQVFQGEVERIESHLTSFPWEDKHAYAAWCAQTYYYVCHSTRLLALSAAHIPLAQDELYNRYLKHIQEETAHEKLALSDLKKLGFKLEDFPALSVTSSFYQTQYYYIEHVNPFSLLGYILILEGLSAAYGKHCYDRAREAHGSDKVNFWRVHAEEDPEHVDKALNCLKNLDEAALNAIAQNLKDSCSRYGTLLDTCAALRKGKLRQAA